MHFGEHLMIDGYGGNPKILDDSNAVKDFLNFLVERLEMKKLSEPKVFFAQGNGKKDPGGWSGFVVIMESHISIHTFPLRGFVSADIYTCKNGLDKENVIKLFKEKFQLADAETNFVFRGSRYPMNNICF